MQDVLNSQTFQTFRAYAEKQYPGNPEQQGTLIRQLQNEHYHQYMQQMHAQMATEKNENLPIKSTEQLHDIESIENSGANVVGVNNSILSPKESCQNEEKDECDSDNESTDGYNMIYNFYIFFMCIRM